MGELLFCRQWGCHCVHLSASRTVIRVRRSCIFSITLSWTRSMDDIPFTPLENGVRILDGGMASELQKQGFLDINGDPLWSAKYLHSHPQSIKDVHKSFLLAGADVLLTGTYQASVDGFMEYLSITETEALQLIRRGVYLARQAMNEVAHGQNVMIAGSVGPYGAYLHNGSEYTGTYVDDMSTQELKTWHRPRIKELVDCGVDLLAIETCPAQKEVLAILALIKAEFAEVQAYVTYSCKDGQCLGHGERFSDAIKPLLEEDQIIAIGINCTAPEHVTPLLKSVQHLQCQKPFIVKPNSGESWDGTKHDWYGTEDCRSLSDYVPQWYKLGVRWFGGCCRIYPDDIQQLRNSVIREIKNSSKLANN